NAESGIATLLGNVTVTRGPNTVRGEYAVMDLNNNISRMMAAPEKPGATATRVEGLFVRQDQAAPAERPGGGAPRGGAPKPRAAAAKGTRCGSTQRTPRTFGAVA